MQNIFQSSTEYAWKGRDSEKELSLEQWTPCGTEHAVAFSKTLKKLYV